MSLRPIQPVQQTRPNRLDAVLRAGHGTGQLITEQILGLLTMAPETLFTVRGIIRVLQLCEVGGKMSGFLNCTDRLTWMSLYTDADARIQYLGVNRQATVRQTLVSFEWAQKVATYEQLDDRETAAYFKRLLMRHIQYFALFDPTAFGLPADGVVFNLVWFEGQIKTFLGRSNGSPSNVVKAIKRSLQLVRDVAEFPPVPADFFVSAIRLVAEVTGKNKFYQKGRGRLPELENHIQQTAFY